jgi:peptidoglycan/xylan/chitin deacetylase (PgdA/CDA1 family)
VLDPGLVVSEGFLDAAIEHIIGRGYDIITLSELWRRIEAGQFLPQAVVFTFDDGYLDNAVIGAQIFEKHRVPWCLYLTTSFPDRSCNYWWGVLEQTLLERDTVDFDLPDLQRRYVVKSLAAKRMAFLEIRAIVQQFAIDLSPYLRSCYGADPRALLEQDAMSWSHVHDLVSSDLFELGAHTVSHPALATLDMKAAWHEVNDCRKRIKEVTGIEVQHFAYPFGNSLAASEREFAMARDAGYRTAATTVQCNVYATPPVREHALPRIWLDGRNENLSQIDMHLSGLTGLLALRRQHPLISGRSPSGEPIPAVQRSGGEVLTKGGVEPH